MKAKAIEFAKRSVRPIQNWCEERYSGMRYESAHRVPAVKLSDNCAKRLNLVIPSLNTSEVYGGATTALNFAFTMQSQIGCELRLLTLNEPYDIVEMVRKRCIDPQAETSVEWVSLSGSTVEVRKNDQFIATYWSTALLCDDLIRRQRELYQYQHDSILIYLIQDYEPGFYPWSTEYAEADRTYRLNLKTIAVFNSVQLKQFFANRGYTFYRSYYFDPVINEGLKKVLLNSDRTLKRKKQILLYGRPLEYRNAFNLAIDGLRNLAILLGGDARDWEVISLGAKHGDVRLPNGMKVRSLGKVTIEKYAEIMLSSYAGLSLMISPHPSYPPLEMSTFGVRTVTNNFEGKNLHKFNRNLTALDVYDAKTIAETLYEILADGEEGEIVKDGQYVESRNVFEAIVMACRDELDKVGNK